MITSVGHDSKTSCASIRAGISRKGTLEFYSTLGEDSGEEEPVSGCPVAVSTEGFVLVGRWARLAISCLEDCARALEKTQQAKESLWQETGLIVVLPQLNHDRFQSDEECTEEDVARAFIPPVLGSFSRSVLPDNARVICRGHAGIAHACIEAGKWINSGAIKRVIVIGVDSYLDPHSIGWLDSQDRLFSESNSAGVVPGEAAAGFVLEASSSSSIGNNKCAVLLDVCTGLEARNYDAGELSHGEALSAAVGNMMQKESRENPRVDQVISDMNGEPWRSHEFGGVRTRMREIFSEQLDTVFPAVSIGNVGAASGAVAVNMCVEAFDRRYAKSNCTHIFSSSENGEIAVMIVGKN